MFIDANERGDGGTALENATLGRILGFNTYLDQNVNAVMTGADTDATFRLLSRTLPVTPALWKSLITGTASASTCTSLATTSRRT